MKIVIPALLTMSALLLFSCKKEHKNTPAPDNKLYTLNFNINPRLGTNSVLPGLDAVSSADTALLKKIKTLSYFIYDSKGNLKSEVNQDTTFSNFGTITDQVANGTYYAYFLGNGIVGDDYKETLSKAVFAGRFRQADLFYKADTIIVNGSNINSTITMGRVNAMLELDIQDAVPGTVSEIVINDNTSETASLLLKDTTFSGYFVTSANGAAIGHEFTAAENGTTNVKIDLLVYGAQAPPHTITLTVYGPNSKQIGNPIVIPNVKFIANEKTILTGTVFDKLGSITNDNTFQITIDPTWNSSTINL